MFRCSAWLIRLILLLRCHIRARRNNTGNHILGNYPYLDRNDWGRVCHVCRLKYNGAMDNWDFAIFKYSDERYDPEEWLFPGGGHVDGTVVGTMRAGLGAYPA